MKESTNKYVNAWMNACYTITEISGKTKSQNKSRILLLLLLLSLLLLLIYFVMTSIRIYNQNLYSCSFKLIQVDITKNYTKKQKC